MSLFDNSSVFTTEQTGSDLYNLLGSFTGESSTSNTDTFTSILNLADLGSDIYDDDPYYNYDRRSYNYNNSYYDNSYYNNSYNRYSDYDSLSNWKSNSINTLVSRIYKRGLRNEMKFFNEQLYSKFFPDINGYTLCFMVPPAFSSPMMSKFSSFKRFCSNLTVFAAVDFTPPQIQVNTDTISPRTGGIPFVTEVAPTEQCTVTFIDNQSLNIFNFHCIWIEYMKQLVEGTVSPDPSYYTIGSSNYGALDYVGAFFFVRYDPTMKQIKYVGKATGCFPQSSPSKELIGSRTANELTTLPYSYFCAYYEESTTSSHKIWSELAQVLTSFGTSSNNMNSGSMSSSIFNTYSGYNNDYDTSSYHYSRYNRRRNPSTTSLVVDLASKLL